MHRVIGLIGCALLAPSVSAQVVVGKTETVEVGKDGTTTTTVTTTSDGPAATKAGADTLKSQADAVTSIAGNVPSSGTSGAVTMGTAAGTQEANALVTIAVRSSADRITNAIAGLPNPSSFNGLLVGTTTTTLDVSAWQAFDERLTALTTSLSKDADSVQEQIEQVQGKKPPATADVRAASMQRFAMMIPLVAAVAPKVLSFAIPDYQPSGIALTPDDYMLQITLLAQKKEWVSPVSLSSAILPQDIKDRLTALDKLAIAASTKVTKGSIEQAKASQSADATIKALSDPLKLAVTLLAADVASYNSFVTSLSSVSGTTTYQSQVVMAKKVAEKLAGPGVLIVKVHAASGGLIAEKGLPTWFGGMPLFASSGVVVSYALYRSPPKSDSIGVISADLISVSLPYNKIRRAAEAVAISESGRCTLAYMSGQSPNNDTKLWKDRAKSLCPVSLNLPPIPYATLKTTSGSK